MKQFETFCNRCRRKIIMTWSEKNHRWVPCDCEIGKYRENGGPFTYVDPYGNIKRGARAEFGATDAEFGYQQHRRSCTGVMAG